MSKQKLLCIVGKSGAGKDALAKGISEKTGWKQIPSYCDYPPRNDQTEGVEHTFLTKEQFDEITRTEHIIAYTEINKKRYCTTTELFEKYKSDNPIIYVIDPVGIKNLEDYPHIFDMRIMYVDVPESIRAMRMLGTRHGFNFKERFASENESFDNFAKTHHIDYNVINVNEVETTINKLTKDLVKDFS